MCSDRFVFVFVRSLLFFFESDLISSSGSESHVSAECSLCVQFHLWTLRTMLNMVQMTDLLKKCCQDMSRFSMSVAIHFPLAQIVSHVHTPRLSRRVGKLAAMSLDCSSAGRPSFNASSTVSHCRVVGQQRFLPFFFFFFSTQPNFVLEGPLHIALCHGDTRSLIGKRSFDCSWSDQPSVTARGRGTELWSLMWKPL